MSDLTRDLWIESLCNGLSALQGGPILNMHELTDADFGPTSGGDDDDDSQPGPDIKPPLPNEVPAPQPAQPDVSPYQPPPPANPGMPSPEAWRASGAI